MKNKLIYVLTAPIRLFGRSRSFRLAIGGALVIAVAFTLTNWLLDRFLPSTDFDESVLADVPPPPPLPQLTRASYVIAPAAIALTAIRDNLETAAPRKLVGENDDPVSQLLSQADIGITVERGPMAVTGRPNEIAVSTSLNSALRITGELAVQARKLTGQLTDQISGLIAGALGQDSNRNLGDQIGGLTNQALDQRADVRGTVLLRARPALKSNWRLQPNMSAQLSLGESSISMAGIQLNMATEARGLIEQMVNEQVGKLDQQLSTDPFIELAARTQWAKMCRSIPLGGGNTGLPQLWLEMRPVRAAAAQPQIGSKNVTLTIGVHAETRITDKETKPDCPFPATLELVPPMDKGKLAVGVPIDLPFTTLNKLLEAQLKGHTYPEDGSGPAEVTVRGVHVSAASDRLLISLSVTAREKKSWFGFGANATVHIWGRPTLDQQNQILRLTDVALAVNSPAAYGLINAAARAAMPYLRQALADNAVVDLKPFAADARKKITAVLADFRDPAPGTRVDAVINDLRLAGIAFDARTLRIIAEAGGTVRVAVTQLPKTEASTPR
jgi:hypothetical protein